MCYDLAKNLFSQVFPNKQKNIKNIEKITCNFSNHVFKFELDNNESFKVRIGNNNQLISRKNEYAILNIIEDKNVLFYEKSNGNAIYIWIEGRNILNSDLNEEVMKKIYDAASCYHRKDISNVNEIIKHNHFDYEDLANLHIDEKNKQKYRNLIDKYKNLELVLTHNDVSTKNLILNPSNNSVFLIDYEWGRLNTIYWEFGNFVREIEMTEEQINLFSKVSNIDKQTLIDFAYISTYYALQISYAFGSSDSLTIYKKKLDNYLNKFFNKTSI